jgi:hypothetical protein
MLSERENGFKIAVNILNIGRIKLGVGALGGSKATISQAIKYSNERKQFGVSISTFGAIKHKIAEVVTKIFASESAHYRASQNIDDAYDALVASGVEKGQARLKSLEDFAIECAILKVHGSEVLDFSVDEGVQIYGGMGFSAEGPMDRAYRDARINRIFEGTNEINRMLSMDMLLKRALKGHIDLMSGVATAMAEWGAGKTMVRNEGKFGRELSMLTAMKKAFLLLTGATVQHFQASLSTEQEILMNLSDMMGDIYLAESALLRAMQNATALDSKSGTAQKEMVQVFMDEAMERFGTNGRRVISAWATGEEAKQLNLIIATYGTYESVNKKEARRRIAAALLAAGGYCF